MPDAADFHLFVSYACADNVNGWVTTLIEKLTEQFTVDGSPEPLRSFFDKNAIREGRGWEDEILTGLRVSRAFLAILSPNYFASDWCRREWAWWTRHEMHRHCIRDGAAPIYFLTVDGFPAPKSAEDIAAWIVAQNLRPGDPAAQDMPDIERAVKRFQPRQAYDLRAFDDKALAALAEQSLKDKLHALSAQVREVLDRAQRAQRSPTDLPAYNPAFTGRVEDLIALRRDLALGAAGITAVVHGLGGIGKTELALAYAHAYGHEYPGGRYLVKCAGAQDWRTVLERFGDARGWTYPEPVRQDAERHFAALLESLHSLTQHMGRALLVCDNVDTDRLLREGQITQLRLRDEHFHLLFTTRLEAPPQAGAVSLIHWKSLDSLPIEDATELLEVLVHPADVAERNALGALAAELGGFTIAVELAGRHLLNHPEVRPTRLLAKLKQAPLEELGRTAGLSGDHLIRHQQEARLDFILGETIEKLSPPELRTLEYAAQLAPDAVPLFMLRHLVGKDFLELAEPVADAGEDARADALEKWSAVLLRLVHLRLLVRPQESAAQEQGDGANRPVGGCNPLIFLADPIAVVSIHRLVQEIIRQRCGTAAEERRQAAVTIIRVTCFLWREHWHELCDRWLFPVLEAIADAWLSRAERGETALVRDADCVADDVCRALNHIAAWNRAEALLRRAKKLVEKRFGAESPELTRTLNGLAVLLQITNRVTEAEALLRRALAIDEASYGSERLEVAACLHNLAHLLLATNRLEDAEPHLQRVVKILEKSLGKEHPQVAIALSSLAMSLRAADRLEDAEPLMRRALAIDEANYGKEHPKVAIRLNNLALLLKATHRLAEAEPLYRRALGIDEASYGGEHPEVATDLHNLAQILRATNRLAEAKPLMERALAIDGASYDEDHPNVARDLHGLAQVLQGTDNIIKAEPLMRRAVTIYAKFTASTGHAHPDVQTVLNNYHYLLTESGLTHDQAAERVLSAMAEVGLRTK